MNNIEYIVEFKAYTYKKVEFTIAEKIKAPNKFDAVKLMRQYLADAMLTEKIINTYSGIMIRVEDIKYLINSACYIVN
jgi:hypothetical protein